MVEKVEETVEPSLNAIQIIAAIAREVDAVAPQYSEGLKFSFRGVNQVVDTVAPLLDKYGLLVIPELVDNTIEMHAAGSRWLTDSKVVVRYHFIAPDGSEVVAVLPGYSYDYSDRAAAQSMSVALRLAYIQVFHLKTTDPEPEEVGLQNEKITQEVAAEKIELAKPKPETVESVRAKIAALISDPESPYDGTIINTLGDQVTGRDRKAWGGSLPDLKKLLKALDAGQMPDEVTK